VAQDAPLDERAAATACSTVSRSAKPRSTITSPIIRAERPERSGGYRPSSGRPTAISSDSCSESRGGDVAVGVTVSRIAVFIGIPRTPLDRLPASLPDSYAPLWTIWPFRTQTAADFIQPKPDRF
jgi:hypothetical protein